jgi:tetratricopeptide (TPR) repeat protein
MIFAAIAYRQVGYWRDSATLFTHTIAVIPPNALAEYSLGQTLEMTVPDRAIEHLRRAIDLVERARGAAPEWHAQAYVGVGTALMMKARPLPLGAERTSLINEAMAQFQRALAIDPNAPHAKNNIALAQQWLSAR